MTQKKVTVLMTKDEFEFLDKLSKDMKISKSEVMRAGIGLERRGLDRPLASLKDIRAELKRLDKRIAVFEELLNS